MQAGDYHRENGLHLRENGLHLRENGLLREDDHLRDSSSIEHSLKLRLSNGHSSYDVAKLTSNRHPIPNGYKHEFIGNSDDVKQFETSNPPSPAVDPQNPYF
ncbi:hypothetical protein Phum_PHUM247900 [Pediculus humanus corporis]|uniref:Uncharacterized protein n=1 Tax=Pediculus humanus subsp. corporis TaxID=121224 RepID=E0VJL1_PEDHC|nr:uncharacterized protein Phum_PHUM247900 [Pediculus humanus corporis]EEB13567.1 hypothetical protein Phum_PHUM247900 [Pediculus humanus corporis]